MVAATAAQIPQSIALRFADQELSYAELDARANGLAYCLREWGVGTDVPVVLVLERSIEMIVAVLAVLKAGGAYVPLDPAWPSKRLSYALSDCKAPILLTHTSLLEKFSSVEGLRCVCLDAPGVMPAPCAEAPAVYVRPQDLAYVIYTSGSTGEPKGVAMPHGPVCNLLCWQRANLATEGAVGLSTLQYTSLGFDVSVQEIFSTLVEGGTLHLIDEYERRDSLTLLNFILEHQVQRLFVPFVALDAMCQTAMQNNLVPISLLRVMTAGEQLRISPAIAWLFSKLGAVLHNQYGPTETCIIDSEWTLRPPASEWPTLPPIGMPISNVSFWVMDEQGQPLPAGKPGELWHGGACLARGYLGRGVLTDNKFVPHPFQAGERLYRSGDLVRRRADGVFEFLGRIDEQVKLYGYRIELGEVEAVIASHPLVREVAVQVFDSPLESPHIEVNAANSRMLMAFVSTSSVNNAMTPERQSQMLGSMMRPYLRERLPEYMLPDIFVQIETLPRSTSGKLDRTALSSLKPKWPSATKISEAIVKIQTTDLLESQLLEIWQEVLERDDLNLDDNLFDAGGHSLLALRLRSILQDRLGRPVALRLLFENPCVRNFAIALKQIQATQDHNLTTPDTYDLLGKLPRTDLLPMSHAQQGMWLTEQIQGKKGNYNISLALQLEGYLDIKSMQKALTALVQRHEVLRTRLLGYEILPTQIVDPQPIDLLALESTDLREEPAIRVDAWFIEKSIQTLQLEQQGPLRISLAHTGESHWLLLLTIHHAAIDGLSTNILLSELQTLYTAAVNGHAQPLAALPPLPLQYADFSLWQRQHLAGAHLQSLLEYWKGHLQGVPHFLELPTDRPRPQQQSYRGAYVDFMIPSELASQATQFALCQNATPFMVVLAVWAYLLGRYSHQDDLLVGTPVANRPHHSLEKLIGMFVNTLALRVKLSPALSLRSLLAQVRSTCLNGFAHQELPFEQVIDAVQIDRQPAWESLCQVQLAWETPKQPKLIMPGLEGKLKEIHNGTAKFDLLLSITEGDAGWHARMEYASDLFFPQTVLHLTEHFVNLLSAALSEPDEPLHSFSLMSQEQQNQELVWDVTNEANVQSTVHERFADMASRQPQATALRYGAFEMSYAELDARANGLAHRLRELGVGADVPVGLALERSFDMVVAMLAVLKAGGAYVPLDPAYPEQRLAYMLQDCAALVLLTQTSLLGRLPQHTGMTILCMDVWGVMLKPRSDAPIINSKSQDLAYLIYTSGSTGEPKGVAVPHQGVLRLAAEDKAFRISPEDVVLQFSTVAFDAATFEIWGGLLNGACIALYPPGLFSTSELGQFLVSQHVSVAWLTSALFHIMVDEQPLALASVSQLLAGGDVLSMDHVCKLLALMPHEHALINGYGPTENTTFTCCYRMQGGIPANGFEHSVPIGWPIAHTDVYVLDENMQSLPVGIMGELYTGGLGLARGYWGRETLTAERFVPHPFKSGQRLYRTGDLVKRRSDGAFEFCGRIDQQVKLRGYRIELGEIESTLRKYSLVRNAVVVVHEPEKAERRLVAYIVANHNQHQPDADMLRQFLRKSLPDYMLPSIYMLLEELPITPNGKLDRQALPAPPEPQANPSSSIVGSLMECRLLELWRDALNQSQLGINDNFFEFGGNSLVAARLIHQIQKAFDLKMHVAQLFSTQTVFDMTQYLKHGDGPPLWSSIVPMQPKGTYNPLFFFHGLFGDVYSFLPMAQVLSPKQPVYGIQAQGLDGSSPQHERIEDMAKHYADQLQSMHSGPFRLAGYSLGGWIAWATAAELLRRGAQIEVLVMLDVHFTAKLPIRVRLIRRFLSIPQRSWNWFLRRLKVTHPHSNRGDECFIYLAHLKYKPEPLSVRVEMIYPRDTSRMHFWYWPFMAKNGAKLHIVPIENHLGFYEPQNAQILAQQVNALLNPSA